jgi:hypothetical protein
LLESLCWGRRVHARSDDGSSRTHRLRVKFSQKTNQISRKRLAAFKLRLQLGGLPNINEPLPLKPKWARRRTYERISNRHDESIFL